MAACVLIYQGCEFKRWTDLGLCLYKGDALAESGQV